MPIRTRATAKLRMTTYNKVRHPLKDYLNGTPFQNEPPKLSPIGT
jgi:hypothetical protein